MEKSAGRGILSYIAAVLVFLAVLAILVVGTSRLSSEADAQGVDATYNAIQRAAVLCYATEGFYPPSISYMEERYGIQIDYSSYVVRYEVFASNVMPEIYVFRL